MVIREGGGREVLMLGQVKVSCQLEVIDFHLICLEGSSFHEETLGNFLNEREALAFLRVFFSPWVCVVQCVFQQTRPFLKFNLHKFCIVIISWSSIHRVILLLFIPFVLSVKEKKIFMKGNTCTPMFCC